MRKGLPKRLRLVGSALDDNRPSMSALLDQPLTRLRTFPLSVAAYHAMGELGFLPEKTELLEGTVLLTMPKSPLHNYLISTLADDLRQCLGTGWFVREEKPISLDEISEPEPDISVVRGESRDFLTANPTTATLVVEVAVTTAEFDRAKASIYARGGVPECWIVLGPEKQIEVLTNPAADGYRRRRVVAAGEPLQCEALPGFTVDWARLFPA